MSISNAQLDVLIEAARRGHTAGWDLSAVLREMRDDREQIAQLQETNKRLNRRCQQAESALGDLTKHPSVNQSRTGRTSFAVMAVAVRQATERAEAVEDLLRQAARHLKALHAASVVHLQQCQVCALLMKIDAARGAR